MKNSELYTLPDVPALLNSNLVTKLRNKLDNKTKPIGALGRLEDLALRIGLILGNENPELIKPQMLVCAADHGLTAEGISAYPSDVTWQMVENFLAGGAAVSVLSKQNNISLNVVDCGVRHDFEPRAGLFIQKVSKGTENALQGPAMSIEECQQAINNGMGVVRKLTGNSLLIGEMGIGNSSAAAMLLARLTGKDISSCTGSGTGMFGDNLEKKTAILERVLEKHKEAKEPLDALAAFGGLEVATLTGAVIQAASERRVIVVDGFIASSAVLVASRLRSKVLDYCIFSHRSDEQGHSLMLNEMGAEPILDLKLRLGEGSGAALAWPLLMSACTILREMASFEAAGVSREDESR
ncbi:nicotinate-nucleotide--dimethylbenzimidazole phosphoribosyltransferase [Rhodobacteraceae bacterium]|nr:nicotinate-nucleotide--dimethylbenzimidazole phosphoribosyltransferase [Paracoccaceae bacterium]